MEKRKWDLLILDANPQLDEITGMAVNDIDNDGFKEIVIGGNGKLAWYRPHSREKGIIDSGFFGVGLEIADIDGDGLNEIIVSKFSKTKYKWKLCYYKYNSNSFHSWKLHIIDPERDGQAHDIVICNFDHDNSNEILANSVYCDIPELYIYKKNISANTWKRHIISSGINAEGLAANDLNVNGSIEIIHGPYIFSAPINGLYSEKWKVFCYAPSFREFCKIKIIDINKNGKKDIIIAESEYVDGKISWFENLTKNKNNLKWCEHEINSNLNFAHSLQVRKKNNSNQIEIFQAEMAAGGWAQPYNWNARLFMYISFDKGKSWKKELIYKGIGTHEAEFCDINDDGQEEIIGKIWGQLYPSIIQIWTQSKDASKKFNFRHQFIDRDKPTLATDILSADINKNGFNDIICGSYWYQNPNWKRHEIPEVYQIICAYDIDSDGIIELIGTKKKNRRRKTRAYKLLTSELIMLKPINPERGHWKIIPIGKGSGDWPHGATVAPIFPNGELALIITYHDAHDKFSRKRHFPEIFRIPKDINDEIWEKSILSKIFYGEEIIPYDMNKNGLIDLIAGPYIIENKGNGEFETHKIYEGGLIARVKVSDVDKDGYPDIIYTIEDVDWTSQISKFSAVGWLKNPGDFTTLWKDIIINKIRSPHSLDCYDIDKDGEMEIIVGEHDPFKPYRSKSRLYIYKKSDPIGSSWYQYIIDKRFSHHDGTKIIELNNNKIGIISHSWVETNYVHLWTYETK